MLNFRSVCLHPRVILLFAVTWIACTSGSSVNLTIEGGVSLVGPHCPGTVRLFCEGVNLPSLRWRYNGVMNIISYFPDGRSTAQPTESAFFIVQLMTVELNQSDPTFANFSSFLAVNFSQLQSNNVFEISCGTPGIPPQVKPVNVSIIEPGIPITPTITMVTATYQGRELKSVEVKWAESDNFCPSYGITFIYEVNITSLRSNRLSCADDLSCTTTFNNLTGMVEEFVVSIKVENEFGSSDLVVYPTTIAHQTQQYFIPEVFIINNQLFGRCERTGEFTGTAECTIQYTTDSMYRNLSAKSITPLGTQISLLEIPITERTYFFQFSLFVNNTLQIVDRIEFSVQSDTQSGVPGWGIALIVIAVIVIVFVFLALGMMTAHILILRRHRKLLIETPNPITELSELEEREQLVVSVVYQETIQVSRYSWPFHLMKGNDNVFNLELKTNKTTYTFSRKHSEFEQQFRLLKGVYTVPNEMNIPFRGGLHNNRDVSVIDNINISLTNFIVAVMKTPGILENASLNFKDFLDLNNNSTLCRDLQHGKLDPIALHSKSA